LADPVRRYVLYYFDEQETPVSFDRLATRVAAWHTDSDPDVVDDATLTEIRTALSARERTSTKRWTPARSVEDQSPKSRPSVN